MTKRLSLRWQMTLSYLLVTATAVLLAEAIILAVVFPQALADIDLPAQVRNTANFFVKQSLGRLTVDGQLPATGEALFDVVDARRLRKPGAPGFDPALKPIQSTDRFEDHRTIPIELITGGARGTDEPIGFVLLVNPDGTVRASSYPGRYPPGATARDLPPPAASGLSGGQEGSLRTPAGEALWVSLPIIGLRPNGAPGAGDRTRDGAPPPRKLDLLPGEEKRAIIEDPKLSALLEGKGVSPDKLGMGQVVGAIYVQVPAGAGQPSLLGAIGPALERAGPALAVGLGLLLVTLPVGAVFGLLATRRLTRRVQRLATTTSKVAEGDLSLRLPVEGADEVSQLERGFNQMAERLGVGIAVERQLAGANARLAERARIARELHDSISQSLFSLGMLAGGMRRALPPSAPLSEQVLAMESTVNRMSQEMRALLLELRPADLEEAGLVPALEELCRAYQSRLGIAVEAELDEVDLPAPAEHAVLRLVQEALGNAVRHADPTTVTVRLAAEPGAVVVTVSDDGHGFDPAGATRRGMGLASMRGRVEELGGTFELLAGEALGTTVRATLPVGSPRAMGDDWAALTWQT